jgi:hypothetical protein
MSGGEYGDAEQADAVSKLGALILEILILETANGGTPGVSSLAIP